VRHTKPGKYHPDMLIFTPKTTKIIAFIFAGSDTVHSSLQNSRQQAVLRHSVGGSGTEKNLFSSYKSSLVRFECRYSTFPFSERKLSLNPPWQYQLKTHPPFLVKEKL
jgi:hypothetical protein